MSDNNNERQPGEPINWFEQPQFKAKTATAEAQKILDAVAKRYPKLRMLEIAGGEVRGFEPVADRNSGTNYGRLTVTAIDSARYWAGLGPEPMDPLTYNPMTAAQQFGKMALEAARASRAGASVAT